MVTRAPAVCKQLFADALFDRLRTGFAEIADHRPGTPKILLSDALMSAFALFSLTSPSLLVFDEERHEGNLQRVYGIEQVPCDTRMRDILDPVDPESPRPRFKSVFGSLQRGKALEDMVFIEGHYLLALDGTGYFSSQEIPCASCLDLYHCHGTMRSWPQVRFSRVTRRISACKPLGKRVGPAWTSTAKTAESPDDAKG